MANKIKEAYFSEKKAMKKDHIKSHYLTFVTG